MSSLDFAALNARLLGNIHSLLVAWLPGGRKQGHEYVCAGLAGGKGESFSVNLNTGRWGEFSGTERGGDLVSLYAAIHGIGQGEAYRQLDGPKALDGPAPLVVPNPPAPPLGVPPADAPGPDLTDAEASWVYRTPEGAPWFIVARYPGKRIRPYAWDINAQAWVSRGLPRPRPLYGLELLSLRPGQPVLIVEGEKAAEAARVLAGVAYVVVTWPNGAAAVSATDWTPIHGRKVLIWPDNDAPGRDSAQSIIGLLAPYCPEIKTIDPSTDIDGTLAPGWDAADALREGWDWTRFKAWALQRLTVHAVAATPALVEVLPVIQSDVPRETVAVPPTLNVALSTSTDQGTLAPSNAATYAAYNLAVNTKGDPIQNADNVNRALTSVPGFESLAYFDEFYDTIYRPDGKEWSDPDTSRLLIRFQRELGFKSLTTTNLMDALIVHAHANTRNAPRDWMDTLVWDGNQRLTSFLHHYMGAIDNDYTQAAGRNWWISMIARVYQPGCKVDTMLILQGEQGRFKSTAFDIIGGPWYAVATADVEDPKAFAETMRGKLILELAELASFNKAESGAIKRLLTDRCDRYRAAYGRFAADHPRRGVLVGTTNMAHVHNDETGGRRFWPVWVERCDIPALTRDREQLFAEAVHLFKSGATWWDMPASARDAQNNARDIDEAELQVGDFLKEHPEGVTLGQVWTDSLGRPASELLSHKHEQIRLGKIMRSLRWQASEKTQKRDGKTVRLWRPIDPPF